MAYNYPDLASDIRSLRASRKEVCLLSGVSYIALTHWLNGFSNLSENNVRRLSDVVDFFNGKITRGELLKKQNREEAPAPCGVK